MTAVPLLEVQDLVVNYKVSGKSLLRQANLQAVRGISFTLNEGEVLGLVGESGCGKSSLARAIVRLVDVTSGKITWQGVDLLAMTPAQMRTLRQELQIIFQDPISALNPRMTVGAAIAEPLRLFHPHLDEGSSKERVLKLMGQVGLPARMHDRYPHEISGGQAQRICIARALVCTPKLLVCDEPVSALDVSVQAQIINLLIRLRKTCNLAMLFISHDLTVVRQVANRVMIVYLGQVMEIADKHSLYNSPKHPYTQALLASAPTVNDQATNTSGVIVTGEPPSPLHPPRGCPFHTRCPYAQPECTQAKPDLVNVTSTHKVACIRWQEIPRPALAWGQQHKLVSQPSS